MAKIVSRPTQVDTNIETLQEILHAASLGGIGNVEDGSEVQMEETLEGLISQTDTLFASLLDVVENTNMELVNSMNHALTLANELDVAQDALANLIGNIDYDEALDHAAADFMDCICASGAADVTADGELEFDERITFNKEDIKPWLREAIVRWVELKMGQ